MKNIEPNQITRQIWVTFKLEGIHCYPDAATEESLATVRFLQYPHRHLFGFRIAIDVVHADRDIEFIIFKHWLISLYNNNKILDLNGRSCETIAEELLEKIRTQYPNRNIAISIDEDGENGCTINYQHNTNT